MRVRCRNAKKGCARMEQRQASDINPMKIRIHIMNEEPFDADMDEMPAPNATYVFIKNPRTKEGKPVTWIAGGATGFIFPLARIAFIERLVGARDIFDVEMPYRDRTRGM